MRLMAQKWHWGFCKRLICRLKASSSSSGSSRLMWMSSAGRRVEKQTGGKDILRPEAVKGKQTQNDEEIKRIQMGGSDSGFHTPGRSKVRRSTVWKLAIYTDRQAVKHSNVTRTHGKSMNIIQKLRANVTYCVIFTASPYEESLEIKTSAKSILLANNGL